VKKKPCSQGWLVSYFRRSESPAMAEAMAYDGVLPETLVILVEA
jgi:hypothetical protein